MKEVLDDLERGHYKRVQVKTNTLLENENATIEEIDAEGG